MKAIYQQHDILCVVITEDAAGVVLEPVDGDEGQRFYVSYDDPDLIVDPTDDEVSVMH